MNNLLTRDFHEAIGDIIKVEMNDDLRLGNSLMNKIPYNQVEEVEEENKRKEENKFKSDKEFVLELLKQQSVLTVHGSGFGEQYGSGHFRIVYLPKMEILESAMNKIEDFVR